MDSQAHRHKMKMKGMKIELSVAGRKLQRVAYMLKELCIFVPTPDRQKDRQRDSQAARQTDRQAERQAGRKTVRQTDR